jgi:tRNA(fMet)-specific endonuclease VapC
LACLDTTVLLDLRGRGGSQRQAAALTCLSRILAATEAAFVTRFNLAELYVGVYRSTHPTAERDLVARIASRFPVLEFTDRAADHYGLIMAHCQRLGRPIDHLDALIAAVATANNQRLITRNPRHFADMPGLVVETY